MTEYEVDDPGGKNGPRTWESVSSMFFSCAWDKRVSAQTHLFCRQIDLHGRISTLTKVLASSIIPITFSSSYNTKLDHTLQVATIGISLKMNRARATPVSKILIDMSWFLWPTYRIFLSPNTFQWILFSSKTCQWILVSSKTCQWAQRRVYVAPPGWSWWRCSSWRHSLQPGHLSE